MATPNPADNPGSAPQSGSGGASVPVRPLTTWALLALAAVVVLFSFLRWIFPPSSIDFLNRVDVGQFANTTVLVAPLLAMLVATQIGPVLRGARLMGLVALITYAAALLFGLLAFLLTIADKFDDLGGRGGFHGFGAFLQGLGNLASELLLVSLLALAALWTFRIFTGLGGRLPAVNVRTE